MRFLLVGCLATLFLLGCGNNSSQELETNTIEQSSPRITIKNEMMGKLKENFKFSEEKNINTLEAFKK